MTTTLTSIDTVSSTQRRCALLCLVAGLLGAACGVALALVDPAVGTERFSFPQSAGAFTLTQSWFFVHHFGLLAGLLGLGWSGAVPRTRLGLAGWRGALAGMVGLTVTELVAISAADATMSSTAAGVVGALYAVDTLVLGISLVAAGIAVARAAVWQGWRRWIVLALGCYVFVPLIPALAVATDGARLAIAGWMLLFAALGLALLRPTPIIR